MILKEQVQAILDEMGVAYCLRLASTNLQTAAETAGNRQAIIGHLGDVIGYLTALRELIREGVK